MFELAMSKEEAIIYLSNQRGCSQVEWHRNYHTLNFGAYFSEHRKPFGNLRVLNDETLKGSCTVKHQVQEDVLILLLPIVGACEYKNSSGKQGSIEAGQLLIFFAREASVFEISNPYKTELINYLHIELTTGQDLNTNTIVDLDLDKNKNKLIPLLPNAQAYLGKFDGREEGTYTLKDPAKGIFIFVIEGAFEVQNRLLQLRDGLALWKTNEVEFEALSNDAIILVVEQGGL